MADDENLEQAEPVTVTEISEAAPAEAKRTRSARKKSSPARTKASTQEPTATKTRSRRHSDSERAEKLSQIEARLSAGETLKSAVKDAGISEQTYYQWKRAADAVEEPITKAEPSTGIDTLADLVELEQENIRLRLQLAKKLRAENAELRKRLGLD
jgi:putative transposase